ncbi:MAG TPA: VCBS repeat-containing protein, partial [Sorangium sp.]|nr:VCBS repeat-containing protein [Sorangium sp.]
MKYGINDLSAAEVQQLWISTADDINVAESQLPDTQIYWSQPGFDQRFGYGRVNADRAVRWVKDGKIPPEVDMVRPYWFEVLYRDHVQGPVAIEATVAAKRANSYDWKVEWAPGVQPLDDLFTVIAEQKNVPSSEVTGGNEPIAQLDIRTIDTSHRPDIDSLHGENDHTITVRVRALAHYGGTIGDVPGEMRRTYYVHSDPDLLKGFPIYLGDSGELSPKLVDLDGDGVRDILYPTTSGRLYAYKITPTGPQPIAGWPFVGHLVDGLRESPPDNLPSYRQAPGYQGDVDVTLAGDSFSLAPAVADLDGDGTLEVVASSWNGNVYIINANGSLRKSWRLPIIPSCPRDGSTVSGPCTSTEAVIDQGTFAAPVLEDMDGDGDLDIIVAAFDGKVYIWDSDGNDLPGWPVTVHYQGALAAEPARGRLMTTPAVGDFNGDGIPEVLVGSNEKLGQGQQAGALYLLDGRGTQVSTTPWLTNWPVGMTSFNLFPVVAEGIPNAGVIGKFAGTLAAVAHGNASPPMLLPQDPGTQSA